MSYPEGSQYWDNYQEELKKRAKISYHSPEFEAALKKSMHKDASESSMIPLETTDIPPLQSMYTTSVLPYKTARETALEYTIQSCPEKGIDEIIEAAKKIEQYLLEEF